MHTYSFRAVATVLLPAFVLTSVPVYPEEPAKQPTSASPISLHDAPRPTSEWNPLLLDGVPAAGEAILPPVPLLAGFGTSGSSALPPKALPPPETTPPPPPPNVTVNRSVPRVEPPPEVPIFSEAPTDAEITRARVFGEPFVPLGGETTGEENRAFADAILSYLQNGNNENISAFGVFLGDYPHSAWRGSLLANLGAHYQRTGYYTLAGETLQEAWDLTREPSTPAGLAVALSVLSELLDLKMKFGDVEELERILSEAEGLELHGTATERVAQAKMAVYVLAVRTS